MANAPDVLADDDCFLQVLGVTVSVDPARPPFDRATSVVWDDVAATGGAVTVVPKEADCQTPVAEMSTRIVDRDPATDGVQELKQW